MKMDGTTCIASKPLMTKINYGTLRTSSSICHNWSIDNSSLKLPSDYENNSAVLIRVTGNSICVCTRRGQLTVPPSLQTEHHIPMYDWNSRQLFPVSHSIVNECSTSTHISSSAKDK